MALLRAGPADGARRGRSRSGRAADRLGRASPSTPRCSTEERVLTERRQLLDPLPHEALRAHAGPPACASAAAMAADPLPQPLALHLRGVRPTLALSERDVGRWCQVQQHQVYGADIGPLAAAQGRPHGQACGGSPGA